MSTQMEFIMQLYMMNLMQQQQQLIQQQQQQQHQQLPSPTKLADISANKTTNTTNNTPILTRTQKRKNSHTTNCSSSRSCSPTTNSNTSLVNPNNNPPSIYRSPLSTQSTNLTLQQMLLNNISPMTQLLPNVAASSNLLLTPTTPDSMNMTATTARSAYERGSNIADSILAFNQQRNSLANNFLQSSTVTSTPTEKSPAPLTMEQDVSEVKDVGVVGAEIAHGQHFANFKGEPSEADQDVQHVFNDDVDEEEQPLSSLQSSSSTGGETSKLLMCSGVQALESTDSLESPNMPYTPVKQPADSSFHDFNEQSSMAICQKDNLGSLISSSQSNNMPENLDTNVTPMVLPNAILTPPSSEQMMVSSFDSQSQCGNTQASLATATSLDAFLQNEENLKNLKKFSSYLECENSLCRQENLREHFHCFDEPCQGKILSKKDDIIRHLKWHKKRKESLVLGFARFSSSDDCAPGYGAGCAYNWKQTHYHCIYEDCPKVYVSTSDVQMHANFHRKNSEIVQEGFRRFRAHENCKIEDCPFYGKKTSHYHCCREGCQHTFKNKADMDKHKSYHLKDFQLTQDGFKKILKTEACPFEDCKFSSVCNHIHCVRDNCNYILHSSSQMISHKRKHDRLDGEQAYQNYKKQKDSSEEESPKPVPSSSNASTPLSSLSADHFLARKRGRPPKKIQLPAESNIVKRIKVESRKDQLLQNAAAQQLSNILPPFLPNFNPAAAAVQNMQSADSNTPQNFQLTHLMALFQLQNPLFYQNLYPGGMAANMANMLGAAAAASNSMPQQNPMLSNLAVFSAAAAANIKSEFNDKQQYKE